jgi:hypothetical protein
MVVGYCEEFPSVKPPGSSWMLFGKNHKKCPRE